MNIRLIPTLTVANSKRCSVWMLPEHKTYIEDLAYLSECSQKDVLYYIIENYKAEHPIKPIKSRS